MGKPFNIIDKRLGPRLTSEYGSASQTIATDGEEAMSAMVQRAVTAMADFAPVPTLRIFAHGTYLSTYDPKTPKPTVLQGKCVDSRITGGFGVQLAKEELKAATVGLLAPLKEHLDPKGKVYVYSCGSAAVAYPKYLTTIGNGAYVMSRLAKLLGVPVYSPEGLQDFTIKSIPAYYSDLVGVGFGEASDHVDFDAWEGTIWKFEADGERGKVTGTMPEL